MGVLAAGTVIILQNEGGRRLCRALGVLEAGAVIVL